MQSLKAAIDKFLKKAGIEKTVAQNAAISKWEEAVGEVIASNATPIEVQYGRLIVKASTPVWRQELQLQKNEILKKINKSIGKNVIKEIQFI